MGDAVQNLFVDGTANRAAAAGRAADSSPATAVVRQMAEGLNSSLDLDEILRQAAAQV